MAKLHRQATFGYVVSPPRSPLLHAACTVVAVALLAGCSGSSGLAPSGYSVAGPTGSSDAILARAQSRARGSLHSGGARSDVAPHMMTVEPSRVPANAAAGPGPEDLAVTDYGGNTFILNDAYHVVKVINAFMLADGDRYDNHGNLYVADPDGSVVYEYNPAYMLIAQYSTGTVDPISVTTDAADNVYVADYDDGTIVEFPQGVNTPSASCSTGLLNAGVAVDAKHNVFVSGNTTDLGPGALAEYKGGLKGCNETNLSGVSLHFAGGLQIDKHHDLVACDQHNGVDIIPPPYTAISSTIRGAAEPFHAALNKKNTLIYIADAQTKVILVDKYPSGTNVTRIGPADGLDGAAGVAAFPN